MKYVISVSKKRSSSKQLNSPTTHPDKPEIPTLIFPPTCLKRMHTIKERFVSKFKVVSLLKTKQKGWIDKSRKKTVTKLIKIWLRPIWPTL